MTITRVGDKWGKLRITKIYSEIATVKTPGRTDNLPILFYEFQCECGKVKTIVASTFPGRRKMRDCGCGWAAPCGAGRATGAFIDLKLYDAIVKYSKLKGITVSRAIGVLCRSALTSIGS
jgi:hypothetical protein